MFQIAVIAGFFDIVLFVGMSQALRNLRAEEKKVEILQERLYKLTGDWKMAMPY